MFIYFVYFVYVTCTDDIPQLRRIRVEFSSLERESFNESPYPFTFLTLAVSFGNLQYVWWLCEVFLFLL